MLTTCVRCRTHGRRFLCTTPTEVPTKCQDNPSSSKNNRVRAALLREVQRVAFPHCSSAAEQMMFRFQDKMQHKLQHAHAKSGLRGFIRASRRNSVSCIRAAETTKKSWSAQAANYRNKHMSSAAHHTTAARGEYPQNFPLQIFDGEAGKAEPDMSKAVAESSPGDEVYELPVFELNRPLIAPSSRRRLRCSSSNDAYLRTVLAFTWLWIPSC